jgi:hypothetical protein
LAERKEMGMNKSLRLDALDAVAHGGRSADFRKWDTALKFRVEGLPPGEQAWIAEMNHTWRTLLVKDGVGRWIGKHKTPEDALAALAEGRR